MESLDFEKSEQAHLFQRASEGKSETATLEVKSGALTSDH
jgi:hypothetical protein